MDSSYDHGRTRVHAGGGHQAARRGDPELTPAQRDRDAFFVGSHLLGGHADAARGHEANRDTQIARRSDDSSSRVEQAEAPPAKRSPDETHASSSRATRDPGVKPDGRLELLAQQLPPELRADVPIRENNALDGAGVQVVFRDGEFRIEVGPTAEARHVKYHVDATRHLLKFQGPLGYIRRLLSKLISKLTGAPGYGTAGFEARLEVKKLREIQAELEAFKARLVEHAGAVSRGERRDVDREIANIQEQLEHHARRVDSFEPGSGVVAARGLPEYPIKKSTIEATEVGTDPRQLEVEYDGRTVDGRKVSFGTATQPLAADGSPDGHPFLSLGNYMAHHGVDHTMSIYDDVSPSPHPGGVPEPRGDRTPITTHVLKDFERLYERRFKRTLTAWKGDLAFENKLNFWREYLRLVPTGVAEPHAQAAAARAISFGKHRIALGFTEFDVTPNEGKKQILDLGGTLGPRELPDVSIIARKP